MLITLMKIDVVLPYKKGNDSLETEPLLNPKWRFYDMLQVTRLESVGVHTAYQTDPPVI